MTPSRILLAAACLAAVAHPAAAQEKAQGPYWLHVGVAEIKFDASATVDVPALGGRIPGQSATAADNTAFAFEIGYEVMPNWIVSLTAGAPPKTTLTGRGGPLDGAPLGSVKYGPAVVSGHYHLDLGAFRPYVGGGLTYVLAMKDYDAALTRLKVDNGLGFALQAGVDVPLGKDISLFLDVKKLYVSVDATFNGPAPGSAKVKLDPVIVHAGIGWRF